MTNMSRQRMTPELLARAIELQRMGWSQGRIAAEIGLSRGRTNLHLVRFNSRLLAQMSKQAAARLGADVQRLGGVVEQAAEAWIESRKPAVTVREAGGAVERTSRSQAGNPAFLKECREGLASIR